MPEPDNNECMYGYATHINIYTFKAVAISIRCILHPIRAEYEEVGYLVDVWL